MLSLVQRFKPSTKFIFVGDFNQYEPVLDRVGEKPKEYYSQSNIFYELTNGNILRLTKFRRGDEKHFEFVKNSSNETSQFFTRTHTSASEIIFMCSGVKFLSAKDKPIE
jgi:hypothetical protein